MPYSAVTDFTDGDVLSASKLNQILSNVEYLYSISGDAINPGFSTIDMALDAVYGNYYFRRTRRYLHYKISILTGDMDRLKINVNGNEEFNDGTNRTSGYDYEGYFDLDAITSVPSEGDFYVISVDAEFLAPSGGTGRIWWFIESDNTTL